LWFEEGRHLENRKDGVRTSRSWIEQAGLRELFAVGRMQRAVLAERLIAFMSSASAV
jgi:hypothetical protein